MREKFFLFYFLFLFVKQKIKKKDYPLIDFIHRWFGLFNYR